MTTVDYKVREVSIAVHCFFLCIFRSVFPVATNEDQNYVAVQPYYSFHSECKDRKFRGQLSCHMCRVKEYNEQVCKTLEICYSLCERWEHISSADSSQNCLYRTAYLLHIYHHTKHLIALFVCFIVASPRTKQHLAISVFLEICKAYCFSVVIYFRKL